MKQVYRFTASWCGPCKSLAKTLEGISTDIPITVYDVDEHGNEAKQYGVRGVPTMVMVEDGRELGRLVGNKSEAELRAWLNQ